jgi:hypothetical protein
MADNWADAAAPGADGNDAADDDPLVIVPADPNDTNATADDKLMPKRGRVINQPDDPADETSADEIPKPKRGRGRPKEDDTPDAKDRDIAALRRELESLKAENTRLASQMRNNALTMLDMEKDLEMTRSSLVEKEQDYMDLLDQLANHEESVAMDKPCPKGVVLFDGITEPLVTKLKAKANIDWTMVNTRLTEIRSTANYTGADVVLVLTGAADIAEGVTAFEVYQYLKRLLTELAEHTIVYTTFLPPNRNARIQIDLFNHKLSSMACENLNVLKLKLPSSKTDLVEQDGHTPTAKCIALYGEILGLITPPAVLKDQSTPSPLDADFTVSTVVPIKADDIGRIIGKGGNVIKRLLRVAK